MLAFASALKFKHALNANFKNTVFLLAYDKDIVVNAVEQKFKDNGERYLAKIVQVDYTLPEVLEEDIERIFFERLKSFFEKFEIPFLEESPLLKDFWSKHGLKNYFRTLRDVYRYLNSLAFRLPEIWREVNVSHFLVVEAILVFDFGGHQNLYFEGIDWFRRTGSFPSFEPGGDWTKSKFSNITTRELLKKIRGKVGVRLPSHRIITGRDLFNPDAFENYFTLQISAVNLPEKDFIDFLSNPEQGFEHLNQIHRNGRLDNLLRKLSASGWEKDFPEIGLEVVRQLIRFSDNLQKEKRKKYMDPLEEAITMIITYNQVGPEKTKPTWEFIHDNLNSYPHITHFVLLFRKWDHVLHPNEETEDTYQQRIIRTIRVYAKKWCYKIIEKIPDCDDEFAENMLFTLAKLDPNEYLGLIEKHMNEPEKLVWMINQQISYDQPDHPSRWRGDRSPLFPSLVCEQFKQKISQFSQYEMDNLSPQSKIAIQFFLQETP